MVPLISQQRGDLTPQGQGDTLLAVQDRGFRVADVSVVEALIRDLGSTPNVRKDQTSVSCRVSTPEGTFLVEFVRGRRGGHGYFVSRSVLEAVAALSTREGKKLTPPLEALALLKAWAAVDKAKLARSGRDAAGYHAARERAFRVDVAEIRAKLLRTRPPDPAVFGKLLAVCSRDRAKAIKDVLHEAGWEA